VSHRFTFLVALTLFGIFSCRLTAAQASDASKKNCTHPRPTYQPEPPPYHIKKGLGVVTLEILVDEKGHVAEAKIVDSSGDDKFDHDALASAKKWKFAPSLCEGKPAPARIAIEIEAHIMGS
jgi:protein TonB